MESRDYYTLHYLVDARGTLCSVTPLRHTKPARNAGNHAAGMAGGRWQVAGGREACYAKGDTHGDTSSHVRITHLTQLPTHENCQECSETQKTLRSWPTRTNTYRRHQQNITEWLGMGHKIQCCGKKCLCQVVPKRKLCSLQDPSLVQAGQYLRHSPKCLTSRSTQCSIVDPLNFSPSRIRQNTEAVRSCRQWNKRKLDGQGRRITEAEKHCTSIETHIYSKKRKPRVNALPHETAPGQLWHVSPWNYHFPWK